MTPGAAADPAQLVRLREQLAAVGQEHVLRFLPELDAAEQTLLLSQLQGLDLARVQSLIERVLSAAEQGEQQDLQPPELIEPASDEATQARDREARAAGEELLAEGRVAAFLVAGGQGTRLGYAGPKGRYPVGPLTRRSLFAYHAQRVLATCRRYGAELPYYIMTSEANHDSTVAAFEEAGWFGLDPGQVRFLVQGLLPAVDRQGKLLLASRSSLSLSPDGHGGCFAALERSGSLEDMARRGISQIFYFQVDNPLTRVFDPVFVGHHVLAGAEMSTKVVEKRDPAEKVGVLARANDRPSLVEYSDLDPDLAATRDAEGRLLYRAGNIAIHMLELEFAQRIAAGGIELPVHRAEKKVPCVDEQGRPIEPTTPNGIKMEMFVFDALPFARTVTNQLVRREDEFAPVKNAEGADSPATAEAALSAQAKAWMGAAGLAIPEGPAEVGPLFALDQGQFLANLTRADFGPVFDRAP